MIYYWPIQMSLNIQWSIYSINLETQMWIHMSEMWWQVTFTKNLQDMGLSLLFIHLAMQDPDMKNKARLVPLRPLK